MTDIQGRSYTYNNGNELLNYGNVGQGFSLAYDANGNMVSKTDTCGTTTYQYDSENRLIGINGFTADCRPLTASFKYDPFGRRIEKNVNGIITRYVYDREDILFELDGNNNIITEYIHGPGIDELIAMIRNNQIYYYHADGLGSIIAITDSSGNVVQRYEYNSFGEITYQQDPNFKQPYTYTGREYDEESGLYYYRARYYDAKVGRFITKDPLLSPLNPMTIGISSSMNKLVWLLPYLTGNPKALQPYLYSGMNPINFTDPFGLHTYVEVGRTNQGGTIYYIFDDNGNYVDTVRGEPSSIPITGEDIGVCVDTAAQTTAEKLANDYLGKGIGLALRGLNFLLNIAEPFPSTVHAPTHANDF